MIFRKQSIDDVPRATLPTATKAKSLQSINADVDVSGINVLLNQHKLNKHIAEKSSSVQSINLQISDKKVDSIRSLEVSHISNTQHYIGFIFITLLVAIIATAIILLINIPVGSIMTIIMSSLGNVDIVICLIITIIATLGQSILASNKQLERTESNPQAAHFTKYKNTYWGLAFIATTYSFVGFTLCGLIPLYLIFLAPVLLFMTAIFTAMRSSENRKVTEEEGENNASLSVILNCSITSISDTNKQDQTTQKVGTLSRIDTNKQDQTTQKVGTLSRIIDMIPGLMPIGKFIQRIPYDITLSVIKIFGLTVACFLFTALITILLMNIQLWAGMIMIMSFFISKTHIIVCLSMTVIATLSEGILLGNKNNRNSTGHKTKYLVLTAIINSLYNLIVFGIMPLWLIGFIPVLFLMMVAFTAIDDGNESINKANNTIGDSNTKKNSHE